MLAAPSAGSGLSASLRKASGHLLPRPSSMATAARRVLTTSNDAAAADNAGSDDVNGPMLQPSVVNTPWARAFGVAATVAATAASTTVMPSQGANFVHLLAYGIFLGTNVWNSLFVGLTMFKSMPRQMFGRVQSKLFPQYFALTTAANLVLLAAYYMGGVTSAPANAVATLGVSAAASLANWLFIEPKTTTLMFQRYDIENKPSKTGDDEAQIKQLYKKFGMWHGISSLSNLVVLAATVTYGWSLAGRLAL